jgi:hypothetical protein
MDENQIQETSKGASNDQSTPIVMNPSSIYPDPDKVSQQAPVKPVATAPIKKRRTPILIIVLLILAFVSLSLLLKNKYQAHNLSQKAASSGMQKINYNSGLGHNFSLFFYSNYRTKPSTSSKVMELTSTVSKNGKAPLKMAIFSDPISESTRKAVEGLSRCTSVTPLVMVIHNIALNQDINVCNLEPEHNGAIYSAFFHDSKNNFEAMIQNDVDFKKGLSSKDNAQKLVDSTGLAVYNDDIKTIVASIQPE